ncbi:hypothetical protein C2S51_034858 [Perilla frutescens var. frutescens]|nr:hypothetical protein C2S51_034858 [Perilla frutescens var. frutescens]
MREGSAPLRRLFNMEHTSLEKYFKEYSGSPLIRPILMWGTDSDDDEVHDDPWAGVKQIRGGFGSRFGEDECKLSPQGSGKKMGKPCRRNLYRTKSYKRLPGVGFWRCGRFRFKLRLFKKLRVLINGRIF